MSADESQEENEFVQQLTLHQGPVLAYIRSLMPGQRGAQDVLQQTNVTLWKKRDDFTLGTNFKAWAFTVARYQVMSQRARTKRQKWMVFDDAIAERFAAEIDEDGELEDAFCVLDSCLSKLKEKDRELLQVRYASDLNLEDYAAQIGRSAGTLKARLFKIRAKLRKCMEAQLKESRS